MSVVAKVNGTVIPGDGETILKDHSLVVEDGMIVDVVPHPFLAYDPAEEIIDAKAIIGKYGLGCEPASAATIAGLKNLRAEGVIGAGERIACVLTGHPLKDPDVTVNYHTEKQGQFSNMPIEAPNDLDALIKLIE